MSIKIKSLIVVLTFSLIILTIGLTHTVQAEHTQGVSAANADNSPVGGYPFIISDSPDNEVESAVAYNPNTEEYLVAWYNDLPGNDDIHVRAVSKNGQLTWGPICIACGQGHERRYPDIAYNSQQNEYLVVWEDKGDIIGLRISADGQLQGGEISISVNTPPGEAKRPAVDYASTEGKYLVVWEFTPWGHNWHIDGVDVENNGTVGGHIRISEDLGGKPRENPDLAYNRARNEFLVVWHQEAASGGDKDIYGCRVKMSGGTGTLGYEFPIAQYGNEETNPAVAAIPQPPGIGQYLVVYEMVIGNQWIEGRLVTGEGNITSSVISISSHNNANNPSVAANESNQQYLTVWTQADYAPPLIFDGIVAQTVLSDGSLLGGETIFGGTTADNAAVASGPAGDFLVTCDDQNLIAPSRDLYGQVWGNRIYLPIVIK